MSKLILTLIAVAASVAASAAQAPAPRHVFVIVMENHAASDIWGNTQDAPFLNSVSRQAGARIASQYYGVTHPSLPNYLALLSGDTQGIFDDCKAGADVRCAPQDFVPRDTLDSAAGHLLTDAQTATASMKAHWFDGRTLVDQLEAKGLTWRAYMQSLPADDKTVERGPGTHTEDRAAALYAQKHDPFMYFRSIRARPDRLARIVPVDALAADLRQPSSNVANFVWITPDQCHDMHGIAPRDARAIALDACAFVRDGLDHGLIRLGDDFLRDTVGMIESSDAWRDPSGAAIVITWDEDDGSGPAGAAGSPTGRNGVVLGGGRVPFIVLTPAQSAPTVFDYPSNHYGLLRAIEDTWQLDCLGHACEQDTTHPLSALLR